MNYRKYEEMLNRVMKKCPLESGVQTLVFMYLDELFENCIGYEPVIIDNLQKSKKSPRYRTLGGYTDIMVVNSDFEYNDLNAEPDIKLFFEVKALENNLSDHYFQFLGQLLTVGKGYFTNGKTWEYYELSLLEEEREIFKDKYISAEKQNSTDKKTELVIEVLGAPKFRSEVANYNKDGAMKVDPNEFLRLTEHFCEQIRKLNDAEGE